MGSSNPGTGEASGVATTPNSPFDHSGPLSRPLRLCQLRRTTTVAILEPLRYLGLVADITVKNLDDDVLARLARRAESEGVSMQELARRAIARAAAIPELEDQLRARRAGRQPMTWDEFLARRGRGGA